MKVWRVGQIGLGARGMTLLDKVLLCREDIKITYFCDIYDDYMERAVNLAKEKAGYGNIQTTNDYRKLIESPDVDVVIVTSSWQNHVPAAVYAMECGKQVCIEVGGAYALDDCWKLVDTYEKTGIHCMMLENCCFGREELMAMNMVRQGLFGKVVHCEGGYGHEQFGKAHLDNARHFRIHEYINRNCDNYPTHALGPIAKILDINRGNRMVKLTSFASGAWGLNEYARQNPDKVDEKYQSCSFKQGDIIKTMIQCAGGETICLTLDTTLPRPYCRFFTVRGTRGYYNEDTATVWLDSYNGWAKNQAENRIRKNVEEFRGEWDHPIWKKFTQEGVKGGHGGMDWLVIDAYFSALSEGKAPPIDTYDTASWMAITPLSEESILRGNAPVAIPDFTRGAWINRTDSKYTGFYNLDK